MRFLLDTNILSALRRPDRMERHAGDRLSGLDRDRCFVSVVTVMELRMGVLAKARRDPDQAFVLDQWVQAIQRDFAGERTIDIGTDIALRCAELHVPNRRPYNDALIGATALVRGLTLVTRNVVDFEGFGLTILNPWDAA